MKKKTLQHLFVALGALISIILLFSRKEKDVSYTPRDWNQIRKEGVLHAVTEYNAVSYHAQGDSVAGFDYELLRRFAADRGLRLEVTPVMSFEKRISGVMSGQYDLLATGTAVNTPLQDSLLFTEPLLLSKQILVQRQSTGKEDTLHITNQLDLARRHVYVVGNSPAVLRLHHLMNEIADTIYVHPISDYGAEQLIAMVADGDIDYAVCDRRIAVQALREFPDLDIRTDISFTQFHSWGVNKASPVLLDSLNSWLNGFMKTDTYRHLVRKYFKS